jgi:hypothetical protein
MSGTDAFIWFVVTTTLVTAMLVVGIYMAMHSYEPHQPHRGGLHLWHRHH